MEEWTFHNADATLHPIIISYLNRYFIKVAKSPLKWKPTTVVVEKTVNLSLNFLAESHSISFIFTHLTLIISS